ncbi:MAG TPA: DUF6526 family protein [Mucilaginibacter sp.]|jgi:hypothetical protein|nr:DUF6526 family protein [Mucilaginibacter sp.]
MKTQSFAHHTRYVPGYHLLLGSFLILGTIASFLNVYQQVVAHDNVLESILMALLFVCGVLLFWYSRQFAVTVQDRAIRAEEGLRYYILTHKQLDSKLTKAQIIALRFAPDDEFLVLADRAVREGLSSREIKQSIKNWRPDHDRA